jgi:hypothetical protein
MCGRSHLDLARKVTCYFRHLGPVFEKAGITVTPENKKQLDQVIHAVVGTRYKDCPATWHQVKKYIAEDEADFVSKLKEAWNKREH